MSVPFIKKKLLKKKFLQIRDKEQSKRKAARREGARAGVSKVWPRHPCSPPGPAGFPSLLSCPVCWVSPPLLGAGLRAALTPPALPLSLSGLVSFSNLLAALRLLPSSPQCKEGNDARAGDIHTTLGFHCCGDNAVTCRCHIHRIHLGHLSEGDREGRGRGEFKKKDTILLCMSKISNRIVFDNEVTLPYCQHLVFFELLHFPYPSCVFYHQ